MITERVATARFIDDPISAMSYFEARAQTTEKLLMVWKSGARYGGMSQDPEEDTTIYKVVVNQEEQ